MGTYLRLLCALLTTSTTFAQLWSEPENTATCIPQGMLLLDEPYKSPQRPIVALPFCQKYQDCSCCNASHVLTIQKNLMHSVFENPDLPSECKKSLEEIPCRVCDPEVGVGLKERACLYKCNEWFESCQNQYFNYAHTSGRLMPCRTDDDGPMICTQLSDLVADGEEFCEAMGIHSSKEPDEDCWDGTNVESSGLCDGLPVRPTFWWLDQITWMPATFGVLFLFWLLPRLIS